MKQQLSLIGFILFVAAASLTAQERIAHVEIRPDSAFTGRGNANEVLFRLMIELPGDRPVAIRRIAWRKHPETEIADVRALKVYTTAASDTFDTRYPDRARCLGTTTLKEGEQQLTLSGKLAPGPNYLWITADVASDAREGRCIALLPEYIECSRLGRIDLSRQDYSVRGREILLARKLLFAPGDYGSVSYRIPALITAADGSLITLTDRRKYNDIDLPEDIDIVCRRSEDGGYTWSEPHRVAEGKGRGAGFGDAVLMRTKAGKLVALFVGGPGLWASTPGHPNRCYIISSSDDGRTWTTPRDITDAFYGSNCPDSVRSRWRGAFFGSGQGLCLKNGRIMAVLAVRETEEYLLNNYAVYSDDEGETWQVSAKALDRGDEAKVVELDNGDVLMSSRRQGSRLWALSKDGGQNWIGRGHWEEIWGNACDADMIRYNLPQDGKPGRLLHTLPNAPDRRKLSMWLSYDEGRSWPLKKLICPGSSAYSSICVLPDGSIGVYYEEDETSPCFRMYFIRFSLDWLEGPKMKP